MHYNFLWNLTSKNLICIVKNIKVFFIVEFSTGKLILLRIIGFSEIISLKQIKIQNFFVEAIDCVLQ